MGDERDVGLEGPGDPPAASGPRRSGCSRSRSPRRSRAGPPASTATRRARRRSRPTDRARGDRQGEAAGAGTDVEPRSPGRTRSSSAHQDRVVGPRRVRPEERADRGVEVGAVGHLADPVDLLAVRPDAGRPGPPPTARARSAGVSTSGLSPATGDLADELRVGRQDRTEAAVAGGLVGELEGRPRRSSTGLRPRSVRVDAARRSGASGRLARRAAPGSSRRVTSGWSPRSDHGGVDAAVGEARPSRPGASSTGRDPGPGSEPPLRPPVDRLLDRRRHRARERRPRPRSRRRPAGRGRAGGAAGRRAGASSLPPPNRDPAPAARTRAATRPRRSSRAWHRPSRLEPRLRDGSGPLAHRGAGPAVALGDDLGQDRERGLGRCPAAEVEPDRAAEPGQLVGR